MSLTVGRHVLRAVLLAATIAAAYPAAADSLGTAPDSAARGALLSAPAPPETSATPETTAAHPTPGVPVFLGGKELFTVRAARNGLDPTARAAAIRARLDDAVRDVDTPADSVSLRRTLGGVEVRLGRHFLWTITPEDVADTGVSQLARLVGELPARVTEGITRERRGRSPVGILIAVAIALGLTLAVWLLARLLAAAGRRWRDFLRREVPKLVGNVHIGTFEVLSEAQLTGIVVGLLGRVGLVVGVFLLYGYLTAVFSLFPGSQGWSWLLVGFARAELIKALIAIGTAIPGLLVMGAIFLLFRWLTQLSDRFFDAVDAGTVRLSWVHQDLARPTKRLVSVLLWIIAAAIAYPYIPGSQSKAVQGISILLGVMVSLGSSGIVGNVIAGLVLTYSRSFRIGDRVKIGEHIGDVTSLGVFGIKLHTPRNEEITLANGLVASQAIVNYSRMAVSEGLVLHTQVTIGYDAEWRTVHSLLIEAAGRVDGVERTPAPWVFQRALNDYHITYEICCVTRRPKEQLLLYSRLHAEVQDAFARAGVEILSPTYAALRDANAPVLPREPAGPRAVPGGFRFMPQRDA